MFSVSGHIFSTVFAENSEWQEVATGTTRLFTGINKSPESVKGLFVENGIKTWAGRSLSLSVLVQYCGWYIAFSKSP
jgi:hypothetical protein